MNLTVVREFNEASAAFGKAWSDRISRDPVTHRLALRMQINPNLAYEAVTGSPNWVDDFSDEEIETLECAAADMAEEAVRNCEGTERIRELLAAEMAFGWYLEERKSARSAAED
jgi:hypothetical protein